MGDSWEREKEEEEEEDSPIEEVRMTVSRTDDPTLPVWTLRMWVLGLVCCATLSFFNQFFSYRTEPISVTLIIVQIVVLPLGRFLAAVLPRERSFLGLPINPGPFNMKEHVLICIFANAGTGYPVAVVNIIKAFYGRSITFLASWLLDMTTQLLGYGWAGLLRKYVVDPAHMWWPGSMAQISLFRALHEKEGRGMSKSKFFTIVLICCFSWSLLPAYLFPSMSDISWVCWVFPNSVTAHQLGSGMKGLGIGAATLDWTTVASYLSSPLIYPYFSILNIFLGYCLMMYLAIPLGYWALDIYHARSFPIFSTHLFKADGHLYNITGIINDRFELDPHKYQESGQVHLSMFFALCYGFGFASFAAAITHVMLFYGGEMVGRFRNSYVEKEDIHKRMMNKYKDIPSWWFWSLMGVALGASLFLCTAMVDQVQLPWWGLLLACAMAFVFTFPISIISATTNMAPGMNIITEYVMGLLLPGRPIANACFKVYGTISAGNAVFFLSDFKLGHYMKIPPRSMFIVQVVGTLVGGTVNLAVGWWLLNSVNNICRDDLLPAGSPWTCPGDRVFFDASVIWGLLGPRRIFGPLGNYGLLNWFFLGGAVGPAVVWLLHKAFPARTWIRLINIPVLLEGAVMPPATSLNYNSWFAVGTVFNFFGFRYRKRWWERYNYILSAALDAGVALVMVLLYFSLTMRGIGVSWWGSAGEHCRLASCPTSPGLTVPGCPSFS